MTTMKLNTQKLLHLLRAAAVDNDHAAELLVFVGASIPVDAMPSLPLETGSMLFLTCKALTPEDVQALGLKAAFRRCYALTLFQCMKECFLGGDPANLDNYIEVRREAEDWLKRSDAELSGMILLHKLLNRFVGDHNSFDFKLQPVAPFDWEQACLYPEIGTQ